MQCFSCHSTKNLFVNATYKDHAYYLCRECNTNRVRAYRKTARGKEVVKLNSLKSNERYPQKYMARWKLNSAVSSNVIRKPKKCSQCKRIAVLHGHHENYAQPLKVLWLCRSCHNSIHKNRKKKSKSTLLDRR